MTSFAPPEDARILFAASTLDPPGPDAAADLARYRHWLAEHRRRRLQSEPLPTKSDTSVSLVTVIADPEPIWFRRCLESLAAQSHRSWELRLASVGPLGPEADTIVTQVMGTTMADRVSFISCDPGTSDAQAVAAALAGRRGGMVGILGQHDELEVDALAMLASVASVSPIVYSDEDELDESGGCHQPRLKPDWSPDLLMSCPYIGRMMLVDGDHLAESGGVIPDAGDAWEYDMMLRVTALAMQRGSWHGPPRDVGSPIAHVPEVLYHRRAPWLSITALRYDAARLRYTWDAVAPVGNTPLDREALDAGGSADVAGGSADVADRDAIAVLGAALKRRGDLATVLPGPLPRTFKLQRRVIDSVTVSIIVPFRDNSRLLRACVDSLIATVSGQDIELLLVDNGSIEPDTKAMVEHLSGYPGVRLLSDARPFNWAAINNAAVRQASGSVLLFMNDDVEALRPGWLPSMLAQAERPEIGAVGARLLYPDGTLQHAGVVLGLGGAAGHLLRGLPGDSAGYLGQAVLTHDCAATTGACMMTRRAVFDEVGGFDETMALDLNDIDFCMRIREKGYRIVYEPSAELVHHESPSRGASGSVADILRFLERWEPAVRAGDPFLNRNLTRIDFSCSPWRSIEEEEGWWDQWLSILESSPAG